LIVWPSCWQQWHNDGRQKADPKNPEGEIAMKNTGTLKVTMPTDGAAETYDKLAELLDSITDSETEKLARPA